MNTIAPSSLIGSLSKLQETRAGIKARTSSDSCQIRPVNLELLALDRRKNVVNTIAPSFLIGGV